MLLRSTFKEEVKMRSLTINEYFDEMVRDLNKFAVGFEPTLRRLDQVRTYPTSGYPPYDLEQLTDTTYRLSMAVAGFSADDLEITVQDGVLQIIGNPSKQEDRTYLYKGVAGRSFKRHFYLDAWVEVIGSNLKDGVLTIDFKKEIPESMKPRKISIGTEPTVTVIEAKTAA